MLKSILCDYRDAYILVKENITVNNTAAGDADSNNINKKELFMNCAPFTDCISEINSRNVNPKIFILLLTQYSVKEIRYSKNK